MMAAENIADRRPRTDAVFRDRVDAGLRLAVALEKYRYQRPLVLGLPRGGVVVANEVARVLDAPLDAWVVRKLAEPEHPELGLGAVAEGGIVVIDDDMVAASGLSGEDMSALIGVKTEQVKERSRLYRRGAPPPEVRGRTVIVVDDGVAMGGTAIAALLALGERRPTRLVLAVPVASSRALPALQQLADEVVCILGVNELGSVGRWYDDFTQVEDEEVVRLLRPRR